MAAYLPKPGRRFGKQGYMCMHTDTLQPSSHWNHIVKSLELLINNILWNFKLVLKCCHQIAPSALLHYPFLKKNLIEFPIIPKQSLWIGREWKRWRTWKRHKGDPARVKWDDWGLWLYYCNGGWKLKVKWSGKTVYRHIILISYPRKTVSVI